jgi:GNAT superfamily N-acetyltransferase
MFTTRGPEPLSYRRIDRSGLADLGALELDAIQVERFLGPLPDIVDAVRRGPAHSLIGVEAAGELIGFYVVHPDRRDRSCWWLGWFAIDRRQQGRGYGQAVMSAIMGRLRQVEGCRRVRLLVAAENAPALRLYEKAGFSREGVWAATGELIMECGDMGRVATEAGADRIVVEDVVRQCARTDSWARGVRCAARIHGAIHGPPNAMHLHS